MVRTFGAPDATCLYSYKPQTAPPDLLAELYSKMKPGFLRCRPLFALAFAVASFTAFDSASCAEILIERIIMPDAAPSSFAVGLPGGVNFCYDPVRGGLSYVWQGGFLDVSAARPGAGKLIKPAKLLGEVVYRETGALPLRRGEPGRAPTVVFKGYRLREAAVEFLYTVDGVGVREEVRARPEGEGLIRRFQVEAGEGDTRWWYVQGVTAGAALSSPAGRLENGAYQFDPGSGREFTLEVIFPGKQP